MAQQMPLPLTISCSSKSRLLLHSWFLPFWYLLTRVVPDKFQKSSKTIVCLCFGTVEKLQYLSNHLTHFDEIWHGDASGTSTTHQPLRLSESDNPRQPPAAILKNEKS